MLPNAVDNSFWKSYAWVCRIPPFAVSVSCRQRAPNDVKTSSARPRSPLLQRKFQFEASKSLHPTILA